MTQTEFDLLKGFAAKTLNIAEGDFNSLFNEEKELVTVAPLLEAHKSRVAKTKIELSDQYSRGKKETMENVESKLKEKFAIDENSPLFELKGDDLFENIVNAEVLKVKEKSKLKDDDFEKHPKFVSLLQQHAKEKKEIESTWQKKLEDKEREISRTQTMQVIEEVVLLEWGKLNPILPSDPVKAANQKKMFIDKFKDADYLIQPDKTIVLLDKEGKPLQDEHGNPVLLSARVKSEHDKYFESAASDPRSSTAIVKSKEGEIKKVYDIKTEENYLEAFRQAKTPEERISITEAWKIKSTNS